MTMIRKRIIFAINTIHNCFVIFAMFLIVLMTIIIALNVFMRYVLNSGLQWGEEVAKLLVVWFTYIAMAVGVKQGLHISLQLLPESKMPPWANKAMEYIKIGVILITAAVMVIFGFRLLQFTSTSIMPATKWPSSTLYLIVPFSGILILFEAILNIFRLEDEVESMETLLDKFASKGKKRKVTKEEN